MQSKNLETGELILINGSTITVVDAWNDNGTRVVTLESDNAINPSTVSQDELEAFLSGGPRPQVRQPRRNL